jgi:uncharacterized Zn finger protein (UPF0148 family)
MGQYGAEYHCIKCGQEWIEHAGPVECPVCGHVYVRWTNYEQMFGRDKKKNADVDNRQAR